MARSRAPRCQGALIALTIGLALASAIPLAGCASLGARRLYPGSDTLLPGTAADMTTAGFWVSRHPAPDAPILDAAEIDRFNRAVIEKKLVRDLSSWLPPPVEELKKDIDGSIAWIAGLKAYDRSGRRVGARFLAPIRGLVAGAELFTEPRYGFLARKEALRVLPSDEPLFDGPGDPYIDNLQASALEAGCAIVVQGSADGGDWLYVTTEKASGWIRSDAAAIADREAFLARYGRADALTVVAAKADLWEDPAMTHWAYSARMGTRLIPSPNDELSATIAPAAAPDGMDEAAAVTVTAPANATDDAIAVSACGRDDDGALAERILWVSRDAVVEGFLPCTPRSIYEEAFKLLNAPYGWGGSFGEQDCSQFLLEVFATVGVSLPRNSSKQARSGVPIAGFAEVTGKDERARAKALGDRALPAASLLRFPGHIMLYLGSVDGMPYAIHATFGYREKGTFGERVRLINRVVVSNLLLGAGTSVGSHLGRLTDVILVKAEPGPEPEGTVAATDPGVAPSE